MEDLLIVQPWFTAAGHPAQSVLSTARALGPDSKIAYLLSDRMENTARNQVLNQTVGSIRSVAKNVFRFSVPADLGWRNTLLALMAACRLRVSKGRPGKLLFFDGSFTTLAVLWPIFNKLTGARGLGFIYLHGPEPYQKSPLKRWLIGRFLARPDVRLFLRTEELAADWAVAFSARVKILPSLELNGNDSTGDEVRVEIDSLARRNVRFGVLGQLRCGKGIETLVPLFQAHEELGALTVAGDFCDSQSRNALEPYLNDWTGFVGGYLPERHMLEIARKQHYLLVLYDENWDGRLESGVFYLAARVRKPVITFAETWCGRMVEKYGCGVTVERLPNALMQTLAEVPMPGSPDYDALVSGIFQFCGDHSPEKLRPIYLDRILN